jgi:hypothetical protein
MHRAIAIAKVVENVTCVKKWLFLSVDNNNVCAGSAGPVNAFTLWAPHMVEITKGAEHVLKFNKTPQSTRQWCGKCGGHLITEHPHIQMIDVYAATIPDFPFAPKMHVFYGEKVLSIKDGLPKNKDMPSVFGGSGETLPE